MADGSIIEQDQWWNDAEIIGEKTPAYDAALKRTATFQIGEFWKPKDRRNTQDGEWQDVTMPFEDWISGHPREGANPAWGFSRHPVGKNKAGSCIVLGSSVGGARKARAMDTMYAVGLDIDSGITYADMVDKLEELGRFALIYTTFRHGQAGLELKRDEVLRKLEISRDPTEDEVRDYLRRFDKNRYEESFIDAATIADPKRQTAEGVVIALDTPPLDKFRLIFPLAEPIKLIDLGDTQAESLAIWEDKVTGLARQTLGVHFDTSATDPSRLFFLPRHPKGGMWDCAIVQGDPLAFDDIPTMEKAAYTRDRVPSGGNVRQFTDSGVDLNSWYVDHADRFQIADLLETLCPDKVRGEASSVPGKVIECPFEGGHSSEGGSGTIAINGTDAHGERGTIKCSHDSCQGRKNAEYLAEMLQQGWFTEEELFDPDSGFVLEAGEEVNDPFAPLPSDETKTPAERAAGFTPETPESDIRKFLKKLSRDGADQTTRANVTAKIAEVTNLGKREIKAIWKDVERANNGKTDRAQGIYLDEGSFRERCDFCATVMTDQGDSPSIFHSNGRIAEIGTDEHGELRIENIDPNRYKARMEDRIDFHTENGSVEAPRGVVNNVYHRDKTAYPPLHRIIRAPTYAPDKSLITEPGYHPSGVFYQPQVGVVVPRVSAHPTKEEVRAAVDKLIDPFADFRFDAMTREELVSAVKEGKPVPSLCHTLSVALTPLCRAFIDGPTPGHLARKMKPRTGATKLLSAVSYIATLSYARPQSLPDQKAEVQKTIVASFDSGQPFIFFDNLPDSGKVDFGELASGMTAWPYYTGRRLGVTGMVDAANKATWLFTGNRTALSEELALRTLLIVLDPQTEHPEDRTDFKYDIDSHVVAHGGEYLHCLLTIVQHWVSEGCKEWSGRPLGGFERHSKIIGGILESAGIMGFLGNREVLRSTANVASPEDEMMDAMIEMHHAKPERKGGTLFRVWGADAPPQYEGNGKDRSKHYYAAYRVVSIKETLEAESIALSKTGYAQTENGGVIYPDKSKAALGQRIANMVGTVRELGPDREEEEKKQGRYIFEKVFSDKHSVLYGLKHLPLKAA